MNKFLAIATFPISFFSKILQKHRQKQLERLERLRGLLPSVQSFLDELESITVGNAYLSTSESKRFVKSNEQLASEIRDNIKAKRRLTPTERSLLISYQKALNDLAMRRERNNRNFVRREIVRTREFFDSIEGRKLDLQQRKAVITLEDNNLVLAGGGSGKTTTIIGRVNYLRKQLNVPANEILCISFTKESASSLEKRIGDKEIQVQTFHKFGKDTLEKSSNLKQDVFDSNKMQIVLRKVLLDCVQKQSFLDTFVSFLVYQLKPYKSQFEFATKAEYIQYLQDHRFGTLKFQKNKQLKLTTLKQEVVKSVEECQIANYLFLHNVEYEYEAQYEISTASKEHRQYRPDFCIKQGEKTIYIEHLGLNEKGDVPRFFADENETYEAAKKRYIEKMNWARQIHKENNTLLIETYSHEMMSGTLYANLSKKLKELGIELRLKSGDEIFMVINEVAKDQIDSFESLARTFLMLYKTNNEDFLTSDRVPQFAQNDLRTRQFLVIMKHLVVGYEDYLRSESQIDFADMINRAAEVIRTRKIDVKFSHVIVDEFQDISRARMQLLLAIRDQNPDCKVFVVGDDWQSIYRFAGSDVTLFTEFSRYFGSTAVLRIETTYRFANPLLGIASNFVLRNPLQFKKQLRSADKKKKTLFEMIAVDVENGISQLMERLSREVANIAEKRILVLGRYSQDEKLLQSSGFSLTDSKNRIHGFKVNGKTIRVQFMTMHKSKGIEADIVIVANCKSGKYGMPSEITDDPMINMLLSKAETFPNAEERRLFYVALTRAKERVLLLVPKENPSKFALELGIRETPQAKGDCPRCKVGRIILKAQYPNGVDFFGCTNYYFGCDYTEKRRSATT